MGNCLRSLQKRLRRKEHYEKTINLLIAGLDNAGKSLILNEISGDHNKQVLPTMGFRTVSLKYKSYLVRIYDLGGSSQIRGLWPKYYSGIHGLIYVVDASDISRLTENKVVFSELVSHEHVSGKPLLLLANKQDISGAIDELDLVENLEVERVANSMRCPTRVETCSCVYEQQQCRGSIMGIKSGYKWLVDTISKDYTTLNFRVTESQHITSRRVLRSYSEMKDSPSKISIHSNPFKPIQELVSKDDRAKEGQNHNGDLLYGVGEASSKFRRLFTPRNKTAPAPFEEMAIGGNPPKNHSSTPSFKMAQKGTQTLSPILEPLKLNLESKETQLKPNRPYTAPECSRNFLDRVTIFNIPGQVQQ